MAAVMRNVLVRDQQIELLYCGPEGKYLGRVILEAMTPQLMKVMIEDAQAWVLETQIPQEDVPRLVTPSDYAN